MKAIYLDVDGVLCTSRSHLAGRGPGGMWYDWDREACDLLRKVCMTGVRLVVSSTWRKPSHRDELIVQLANHKLNGFLFGYAETKNVWEFFELNKQWLTPDLSGLRKPVPADEQERSDESNRCSYCRGDEIAEHLKLNPEIVDYIILDDDSDMLPPQMDKLVLTHGYDGMSSDNMRQLLRFSGLLPVKK